MNLIFFCAIKTFQERQKHHTPPPADSLDRAILRTKSFLMTGFKTKSAVCQQRFDNSIKEIFDQE